LFFCRHCPQAQYSFLLARYNGNRDIGLREAVSSGKGQVRVLFIETSSSKLCLRCRQRNRPET
jgi:hypothetical protein